MNHHSEPTTGAIARAEALSAGDPDWMNVTSWPRTNTDTAAAEDAPKLSHHPGGAMASTRPTREQAFQHMYAAWRDYRYGELDPAERPVPNGRDEDVYDREAAAAMTDAALSLWGKHYNTTDDPWAAGRAETTTEEWLRALDDAGDRVATYGRAVQADEGPAMAGLGLKLAKDVAAGLLATARTCPTRQQIAKAIHNSDLASGRSGTYWTGRSYYENADAVLALLADQPTDAEAGARALEQSADEVARIDQHWDSALWIADDRRPRGGQYVPVPDWLRERAARLRAGDR